MNIRNLVHCIHETVSAEGMCLSTHDVGHIISLFLEGMIHSEPKTGLENGLQRIADECESVGDECDD